MVPDGWSLIKVEDLLEQIRIPVQVEPNEYCQEIGIRSHGRGIFHKEPVLGQTLGDKRVFKVVPGCLILNIVFAWEQAVATTSTKEEGFIASHRFPQYKAKNSACCVDFLHRFFLSPRGKYLLGIASPGGAGRNKTLGQKEFGRVVVPTPPLPEQKKIARILSIWDKAIETVDKLIENSQQQKKALMQQLLTGKKRLPGFSGEWKKVRLGKVAQINPKKSAKPKDGLVSFVPMEAVSETAHITSLTTRNYDEVSKGFSAFADNDVLVAKITPCFENGKGAQAANLVNGIGFGTTEFHVIRAKKDLYSRFIYYITNSYEFRFRGEANMQGSAGQRRVPTDFLKAYPIHLPPFEEQKSICARLDSLTSTIQVLYNNKAFFTREKQSLMQQLLTGKRRVQVTE
ncbi:hypothetical protein DPQ33_17710 [Oceanidesulfovibrio indonesiensis]|uniref:Type I restriction modification DNA specificity domain-containing protein n=1 Tax=Oceanidesulfovibrio indonesiensis TaxID=54767 RepID=A0A7M3MAQ0_9BACT|nr:restriction endonuclease subunit S [Oceanidesulfovibrio indonesiensis]TVM14230.1 hypothetical protein DPQ33_17710 [Oceanidesulfovibrio indonesiensis]